MSEKARIHPTELPAEPGTLSGSEMGVAARAKYLTGEFHVANYFEGATDDPEAVQEALDKAKEHADEHLDVLTSAARKEMEADLKKKTV